MVPWLRLRDAATMRRMSDSEPSEPAETNDLDLIDSDGRYALTLGPAGHQIWNLDSPESEPVATYPGGEAGFEAAWDRYLEIGKAERHKKQRPIRVLYISAIVAEIAWVVVGLFSTFTYYRAINESVSGPGGALINFSMNNVLRFQVLDQALSHVAIGLLAILLTIWLGRVLIDKAPTRPARLPTSNIRPSDPPAS